MKKVNLNEAAEMFDQLNDELEWYYNKETGEFDFYNLEDKSMNERTKKEFKAKCWVALPSRWDIHGYRIMEDFAETVNELRKQDRLFRALGGKGAFRCFKDALHDIDLIEDWYKFKHEALKEKAKVWCEENKLEYVDEPRHCDSSSLDSPPNSAKISPMKVVVTDYIEPDLDFETKKLAELGVSLQAHQLKFRPEEEVFQAVKDAEVIVVNMVKITESLVSRLDKCKLIIRHGVGYDNVDVEACTKHGIQFAYQPDTSIDDVAEHAITLIFACARHLFRARKTLETSSAAGKWDFSGLFPIYRLDGKTLGLLGCGRIGSKVFDKLKHFGFKFIACDPYISDRRKAALEAEGMRFVDKETLFRESDYISIHTLLSDETRHIVNDETLALMKPTAYLVNTARGPMVDVPALARALREKRIAGAGIDVFEVEPPPPELELFDIETAILSPHMGWASEEAGWAIRVAILDDIVAAAQGKPARCIVNSVKTFTR